MAQVNFSIGQGLGNTPFSASGAIEGTPTAADPNVLMVTNVTGTINGETITGVGAIGSNLLYPYENGPGRGYTDTQGFSFTTNSGTYKIYTQLGTSASTGPFVITYVAEGPGISGGRPVSFSAPAVCFTTGTRIGTRRGEIAVEDLQIGDFAVTASGTQRPVTWIGHRAIAAEGGTLAFEQQPVRVRAGAFGHGLPVRDLSMSPGHPVLVGADADNEGGVLVPVMCLINGTSITREAVSAVTYWHVELDSHDILLAEGLPAESYIDGGDRAFFAEGSDHALHNPDFVAPGWNGRCRPVAVSGAMVEAERLRLDAVFAGSLSEQCAWEPAVYWQLPLSSE